MHNVTLILGDGIGPEVVKAAKKVIDATGVNIHWDEYVAGQEALERYGTLIPDALYKSFEKNKVALKGPITTPIGFGFRSVNVHLRKKYNLFANIRPIQSLEGIQTKYDNLDFVIFRENTEGLYCGIEKEISADEVHAVKKVTKKASHDIIESAFDYAKANNLSKVTVAHKANILKKADGMFLETAREISKHYEDIILDEKIIDNMAMQLVLNPEAFEVIVTTNLYGDILSDLSAGLIGGLGLVPSGNIGKDMAIFEAVHGSAPDIANQNLANPTALIRSGIMLLKHLKAFDAAEKIEKALKDFYIEEKNLTKDLGGTLTTDAFVDQLIKRIVG